MAGGAKEKEMIVVAYITLNNNVFSYKKVFL
jgi:hypothetical protein